MTKTRARGSVARTKVGRFSKKRLKGFGFTHRDRLVWFVSRA